MVNKNKRPMRVTAIAMLSFWSAVWNGIRLVETITLWETLKSYGSNPLYIAVSGGIWLLIGFLIGLGLWRGKIWAWKAAFWGATGYSTWYWVDRLFFQEPRANWPFALGTTVLSLLFFIMILLTLPTRIFFQKTAYERTTKTSKLA
jgi:hypothetical protein